jgi:ubiquitin C-terminal hydrolase
MLSLVSSESADIFSQRFEHHRDLQTSAKIHVKVQFPLQVNMLPYTNRARPQDTRENHDLARSCTYDLLSVVVHDGKLNSGIPPFTRESQPCFSHSQDITFRTLGLAIR